MTRLTWTQALRAVTDVILEFIPEEHQKEAWANFKEKLREEGSAIPPEEIFHADERIETHLAQRSHD